jgi:hypothetical protein
MATPWVTFVGFALVLASSPLAVLDMTPMGFRRGVMAHRARFSPRTFPIVCDSTAGKAVSGYKITGEACFLQLMSSVRRWISGTRVDLFPSQIRHHFKRQASTP